jgi:hypothetical protein
MKLSFPVPASFYVARFPAMVNYGGVDYAIEPVARAFDAQMEQLKGYIKAGSIPADFILSVPILPCFDTNFANCKHDILNEYDMATSQRNDELFKSQLHADAIGAAFFSKQEQIPLGGAEFPGNRYSVSKNPSDWPSFVNYLKTNENFDGK